MLSIDSFIQRKYAIINGEEFPVLKEFDIAHVGWECDSKGYVILHNGKPRLVLSDHGGFYIVSDEIIESFEDPNQMERSDVLNLKLDIERYRNLIKETQEAIEILEEN